MGVLDGLTVLDLSWGVSGPATAMLLADNGADVTRIERPGADPFAGWLDGKVYNRGKRSAVLDLTDADDVARFRKLAATADVVIESFAPGVTQQRAAEPLALIILVDRKPAQNDHGHRIRRVAPYATRRRFPCK